jgi:anti-sigma factor ChrR (cupin superfamily)
MKKCKRSTAGVSIKITGISIALPSSTKALFMAASRWQEDSVHPIDYVGFRSTTTSCIYFIQRQ